MFIQFFFDDLLNLTAIFEDESGEMEIVFGAQIEMASATVSVELDRVPFELHKDFWLGVMAAVKSMEELFTLAYETPDLPQVA